MGMTPDMNQSCPEKWCQKRLPKSFPPFHKDLQLRAMMAVFVNKNFFSVKKVTRIWGLFLTKTRFWILSLIISLSELPRTRCIKLSDPPSALSILQPSGIGCLSVINYPALYCNPFVKFVSLQAVLSCQPVISFLWPN